MNSDDGEVHLHVWDYVVFMALLVVSLAVGFFLAWKDRNQSPDR